MTYMKLIAQTDKIINCTYRREGSRVGILVGRTVTVGVGAPVGDGVGGMVGDFVGRCVGARLGAVGLQ